jgi:hypothetical protein
MGYLVFQAKITFDLAKGLIAQQILVLQANEPAHAKIVKVNIRL